MPRNRALFENVSIDGAKIGIVAAVIAAMLEMAASRRAVSFVPARRCSPVSTKPTIFSLRSAIWSKSKCARSRTAAGTVDDRDRAADMCMAYGRDDALPG
jgi:hypothetical protein